MDVNSATIIAREVLVDMDSAVKEATSLRHNRLLTNIKNTSKYYQVGPKEQSWDLMDDGQI